MEDIALAIVGLSIIIALGNLAIVIALISLARRREAK